MTKKHRQYATGSLLGALLLAGCSTLDTPGATQGGADSSESVAARALEDSIPEFSGRGLLPGADLSRHAFSANGAFLALCSQDPNLVDGDTNSLSDVFVYSMSGNSYRRASLSATDQEPNAHCWRAAVSQDGRYVVFDSAASNLVPGDTNNRSDVFRKDLLTGAVLLISAGSSGQSNGASDQAVLSADGRYVAFRSSATNLVVGDNNRAADIFVRDCQTGTTIVASTGGLGLSNRASLSPSLSSDGRYLAFESNATNLQDTSGARPISGRSNVFVRDLQTSNLFWYSRRIDGQEPDGQATSPQLAGDGKSLVFLSTSSDQVVTPSTTGSQIFRRLVTAVGPGSVTLVSQNAGVGANGPCLWPVTTATGNWVGYLSKSTNLDPAKSDSQYEVMLTHVLSGTTTCRSIPNGPNDSPCEQLALTGGGSPQVAFRTMASTLRVDDMDTDDDVYIDTNMNQDVPGWCPSMQQHTSRIAGVRVYGSECNSSASQDGRFIAFDSYLDLTQQGVGGTRNIYVFDRKTGQYELVSISSGGALGSLDSSNPSISGDGRYVTFVSDSNNLVSGDSAHTDIFLRDRQSGTTTLISQNSAGVKADLDSSWPRISRDGTLVTFASFATNLVPNDGNGFEDVFERELSTGTTRRVSVSATGVEANGSSGRPSISSSGRYISFQTSASNLNTGDTNGSSDIYRRDSSTGERLRVSLSSTGDQLIGDSFDCDISGNGQQVVFVSSAPAVPTDTNGASDVFVRDLSTVSTSRVSVSSSGVQGDDHALHAPKISSTGRYVAFVSSATNLVLGGTNNGPNVFLHDRQVAETHKVNESTWGQEVSHSDYPSFCGEGPGVLYSGGSGIVPQIDVVANLYLRRFLFP